MQYFWREPIKKWKHQSLTILNFVCFCLFGGGFSTMVPLPHVISKILNSRQIYFLFSYLSFSKTGFVISKKSLHFQSLATLHALKKVIWIPTPWNEVILSPIHLPGASCNKMTSTSTSFLRFFFFFGKLQTYF